jgi:hypothetical protein
MSQDRDTPHPSDVVGTRRRVGAVDHPPSISRPHSLLRPVRQMCRSGALVRFSGYDIGVRVMARR